MKEEVRKIIIGILFIGLGGSRIVMDKGGLVAFGWAMALYGVFSLGYGIYLLSKDKSKDQE
jgi:hypothetical protein